MKKQTKIKDSRIGCRGCRLKIEVQKSDSLLQDDKNLIQRGKVVGAGPYAICKVGDIIIFNLWGLDKAQINDKEYFYVLDTEEFVLENLGPADEF